MSDRVSSTLSTARFIEWFSGSARFLISLLFTSSPAGCSVYFNTVLDCLPTKCDTCPTNRHFPFCSSYRVFPLALNCRDGRVLPAQPGPHAQGCLPRGPSFPPPSSSLRSASSAPRWCSPRPEPFTLQNARTAVSPGALCIITGITLKGCNYRLEFPLLRNPCGTRNLPAA